MSEINQEQVQDFADKMMANTGHREIPDSFPSPLGRDIPEDISISQDGNRGHPQDPGENDLKGRAPQASPDVDNELDRSEEPPAGPSKGEPNLSYEVQRKAEYYDLLMRDPHTREAIENSILRRTGGVPETPTQRKETSNQPAKEGYVTREEFEQLRDAAARIAAAYSDMSLNSYREKYPDFKSLENDMIPLARANPNLSPEQLYHLVKIQRNGGAVQQRQSTPLPTEVGPGGGGSRTSDKTDLVAAAVEKARRLPQGPRRTEDALRLIYKAALESEGNA